MAFPKLPKEYDRSECSRCLAKVLAYIANSNPAEAEKWFRRLTRELKMERFIK